MVRLPGGDYYQCKWWERNFTFTCKLCGTTQKRRIVNTSKQRLMRIMHDIPASCPGEECIEELDADDFEIRSEYEHVKDAIYHKRFDINIMQAPVPERLRLKFDIYTA